MWPCVGDQEARAHRGLARAALQHRADLHQLRTRLLVDLARRQRDRRGGRRGGRRDAGAGGGAAAGCATAPLPRPTVQSSARIDHTDSDFIEIHSTGRARPTSAGVRFPAVATRSLRLDWGHQHTENRYMQRRSFVAGASALIALPSLVRAQNAREAEDHHRGRRQEPAVLPAADDRREPRLLQGRGPGRDHRRFRRRLARAAGGDRRQRRRGLGRLRAHHQHAGQGPAPARLRAAGPRAADRARRQPEDDAGLQERGRAEGQEARRHRAGLVDQRDRQLRARPRPG